ncbi:uncharacterized protein HD556DRAFT_1311010 [Suillus plorans]|uniref:Uncharacterized protein n=1 Tax=Suillus plorans TaxID=116603 RepID=A0A9P7DEX9_9AGAM|nr:uncharacterized protein HD556DRAFT_1311010 [Suillus plorans]KAG1789810.1 hypothetical protein HD556DRAFT_1311010 [Suillus plorans]
MCEIINYALSGASKTGQDTDRTSVRENIGSAAAEMSGPLVKVSGPLSKCRIECEVIIVQWAFDMNHESAEYEHSASSSATAGKLDCTRDDDMNKRRMVVPTALEA